MRKCLIHIDVGIDTRGIDNEVYKLRQGAEKQEFT